MMRRSAFLLVLAAIVLAVLAPAATADPVEFEDFTTWSPPYTIVQGGMVAFDGDRVYWAQEHVYETPDEHELAQRFELVEALLPSGKQRVIFSTKNFGFSGLAAQGGRISFGLVADSYSRTHETIRTRIYAMDRDAKFPTRLAIGHSLIPRSAAPAKVGRNDWCGKTYYPLDVGPAGQVGYSEFGTEGCTTSTKTFVDRVRVVSRAGELKTYDFKPVGSSNGVMFIGDRELSGVGDFGDEGLIDLATRQPVPELPLKPDEAFAQEATRGSSWAAIISDEIENAAGAAFTQTGDFAAAKRIKLPKDQAAAVSICGPGVLVAYADQRRFTSSDNYTQFAGHGPITLRQYAWSGALVAKQKYPLRPVEGFGCDDTHAYVIVATSKGPKVSSRLLKPWQ